MIAVTRESAIRVGAAEALAPFVFSCCARVGHVSCHSLGDDVGVAGGGGYVGVRVVLVEERRAYGDVGGEELHARQNVFR